ncbi:MAG TPA: phosphoglucosamine mutase [Pyrinomonadaceae bacterium]|jgi:phosphoglucosamine mutase|nr:phosphoglucosamine mutase [Pyrinomonadaceae bacterium]
MKKLFGTDGIRGEAGLFPLDAATVSTLGRSLARHLAERPESHDAAPRIVTGRDTRQSGAWIEHAFIEGARQAGALCQSAGVITTPGVAFLARTLAADAGVVISASHNPYQDNGIKIFSPSGRKLDDATERLIEADIKTVETRDRAGAEEKRTPAEELESAESARLKERYLDYLSGEVAAGLSLEKLSLAVDCANGAASELAPALFRKLGARVVAINCTPDGRNINRDCGSLHIEGLRRAVLEHRTHLGVAFDGDADRALFVDARGEFVDGDATLWIMAQYLASREELKNGMVVATVMSNIGLEIALRARGWELRRTDVGDKYVLEELLSTGAAVGGEQSGHIIFPRQSLAGDGLITTLAVLRAMHDAGMGLDELTVGFTRYPQVLVNVRVREKRPFDEVAEIARAAHETSEKLGTRGRLLLRYSGTEPLARVMIEGEQQDVIERYAETLATTIRETLGAA